MATIATLFVGLTALLHVYFLFLEMFLWNTPFGRNVFQITSEMARSSATLAANQGLYNGLLAAGLLITFFLNPSDALPIRKYCLAFIVIVGSYGWYSLRNYKIFVVQALPALIALVATQLSWLTRTS